MVSLQNKFPANAQVTVEKLFLYMHLQHKNLVYLKAGMSKAQENSGLKVFVLPGEKNKSSLPHINIRNISVFILRSSLLNEICIF